MDNAVAPFTSVDRAEPATINFRELVSGGVETQQIQGFWAFDCRCSMLGFQACPVSTPSRSTGSRRAWRSSSGSTWCSAPRPRSKTCCCGPQLRGPGCRPWRWRSSRSPTTSRSPPAPGPRNLRGRFDATLRSQRPADVDAAAARVRVGAVPRDRVAPVALSQALAHTVHALRHGLVHPTNHRIYFSVAI